MHHFYHVGILVCDDWIMSSKAVSTEHSSFLVISFRSQHRVLCTKYRGAASSSRSRRSLRPPPMPTGDTRWFLPPKKSPPSLLNPLLPCKKMGVWEGLETFGDPPKCGWVSFNFSLIKINLTLKENTRKFLKTLYVHSTDSLKVLCLLGKITHMRKSKWQIGSSRLLNDAEKSGFLWNTVFQTKSSPIDLVKGISRLLN